MIIIIIIIMYKAERSACKSNSIQNVKETQIKNEDISTIVTFLCLSYIEKLG